MRAFPAARRAGLAAAVLAVALAVAACGSGPAVGSGPVATGGSAPNTQGRLSVVAGENVWGNIAAQIGGDAVYVASIISDPNKDPHEYETDVDDAAAVAHARLVIRNGLGYDDFLSRLLDTGASVPRTVLTVADVVGVHGSDANPHLWYSPTYVATAARAIEAQFAQLQPADASTFAAHLATFLAGEQRVADIAAAIKARFAGTPIAYTERVPGYLTQAAGLRLGVPASFAQAIEDGTDPSPLDNAMFEKALTDRTVKVLLYNAQVTDAQTAHLKALAQSSGVPVVGVTETLPPGAGNFQTWQATQAAALQAALGG